MSGKSSDANRALAGAVHNRESPGSAGLGWLARVGRRRIAVSLLAVALLVIAGLAWRTYDTLRRELTDIALERRASIAHLAAATLSEKLDRAVDLTASLATRVRFADLVAAGQWEAAAEILRGVPAEFAYIDRLVLSDVHGTLMADVPELPGVRGRNFAYRDWYQGVSRGWKRYVSTVYKRAAAPQRNVIAVAVPIRERATNRVTGILLLQISLEAYFEWTQGIDLGEGRTLLVVDAMGQAAYQTGVSPQDPIADRSANPAVRRLREGKSGVEVALDEAGREEQLYAYVPARHGWGVALQQPARAAFAVRDAQLKFVGAVYALIALFLVAVAWLAMQIGKERRRTEQEQAHKAELERHIAELQRAQQALAKQTERLRIVHDIDRAIIAEIKPDAIAAAVIEPLRELLGVPRAIVNLFDFAAGEVEWLAAAGRRRVRLGPGVRYSIQLMGDVEGLKRGEPQRIDVQALPPGPEVEALLASGVHVYMAVPMIAGGELIGALSFGGEQESFPAEQITIAQEVATQLAIAIAQARLFERVKRQAEELELRVRERTAQLEAANKELESFSYSVSHDLRSPLRAIDGFSRIVEEDYAGKLDVEGRRLLGVIRDNSKKMAQLIDDLLEYSRLGRKPLSTGAIDMKRLVEDVLGELQASGERSHRLVLAALPPARGDATLVKQAWTNLLSNAIKFSGKREQPVIEVSGHEDGAQCVYCVKDNGAGFDMRFYEKLFNVFQRLHREEEFEGTGVGLAIVQRVVSRHGGRVWAESKVDEGAEFYFSLPQGRSDGSIRES